MLKTILKILYIFIPILVIVIFFADLLSYYSNIQIKMVSYLREIIILTLLFLWYQILKNKLHFDELTIEQNLIRLMLLIGANYLISILLNTFLNPQYSGGFPPLYRSPSAIAVSTIMTLTAAMTLVPAILILRQLIFYKRKRNTALLFKLFLFAITLVGVSVFITRQPVGYFRFSSDTLPNDISMVVCTTIIVLLAFRNEWITYMSRKRKFIYSLIGIPLYVAIASLFDFAYETPIPAYSLSIAALSYAMWLFLIIYGALAVIKLLFHLPTARAFDRKIHELNSLYDFGRKLNSETRLEKLHPLITELASEVLESSATWLALYNGKRGEFSIVSFKNIEPHQLENHPFRQLTGLNQAIVTQKSPILINDVWHNRQYRSLLQWKDDVRAILGAPLYSNRGHLMGIIYASKSKEYSFDIDALSLLEGMANQAAMSLENVKLLQESIERERLEQELKIARDVQMKLLPQILPRIPNFDIAAYCLSAYEVGGDYYDFFYFSDGKPGIIIGDVSGKGTSAALYMAEFKGIIQTLAHNYSTPYDLICAANRILYANMDRRSFISSIVAKMDPENMTITFTRAGHTPVLYCSGKQIKPENILTRGIGIGLDSGEKFNALLEEKTLSIEAGATAILYTDGVTEARNGTGEEFSEERLEKLLVECNAQNAEELKDVLLKAVLEFCGDSALHDDLTFVIIRGEKSPNTGGKLKKNLN
ncbi:MAG: hypothetical protein Kow0042_26960 [Calditrichia bacterium]